MVDEFLFSINIIIKSISNIGNIYLKNLDKVLRLELRINKKIKILTL